MSFERLCVGMGNQYTACVPETMLREGVITAGVSCAADSSPWVPIVCDLHLSVQLSCFVSVTANW